MTVFSLQFIKQYPEKYAKKESVEKDRFAIIIMKCLQIICPELKFITYDIFPVNENYGLINTIQDSDYDGIILAVPHKELRLMGVEAIKRLGRDNCILFDLKSVFSSDDTDLRL